MENVKKISLNEEIYKVTDEDLIKRYPALTELPTINGKTVLGDLSLAELGAQPR